MQHTRTKRLKIKIFRDYYVLHLIVDEIAKKRNLKYCTVRYYINCFKLSCNEYLQRLYSKDFLNRELKRYKYEDLAKSLKISYGRLKGLLLSYKIKRPVEFQIKNAINPAFYTDESFKPGFFYFLGLVTSDGFIKNNFVRIVIKNSGAKILLEKIAKYASHKGTVHSLKNDFYSLTFTDPNLLTKLNELGVPLRNKTYTLANIKIETREELISFLCGLYDGDGTIRRSKSKFGYHTAVSISIANYNEKFLLNLSEYMRRYLQFNPKLYKHNNCWDISLQTEESKTLFNLMYSISPFYLECKYKKYIDCINKTMI